MKTTVRENGEQTSDEEIVGRILAGEHRLYEQLMRKYNARLYRVGMAIVSNDSDVEDLMQVAYIKAYENLHSFEKRATFGTWLTRILINESLHHLKKRKHNMSMATNSEGYAADNLKSGAATPVGALLNKELSGVLEHALVGLPEKYRIVFVLREMENLSVSDTMDTLQITEANVKVRLNRAKTMLRETLGNYYKNDSIYHFHLTRCDRIVNKVLQQLGIV